MDERKKKETGGKTNGGRRNLLNKQTHIYAHTSLGGWGGVFFFFRKAYAQYQTQLQGLMLEYSTSI